MPSGRLVESREGQADGAAGTALEGAMHVARVAHEVGASPRKAGEELERKEITLEAVAGATGGHEVARIVRTTARDRHDMIEGRGATIEWYSTIDTPLPAVTQGAFPQRPLHGDVDHHARTARGGPGTRARPPERRRPGGVGETRIGAMGS